MKITIAKPDLEAALKTVNNAVGSGGNDLSTHYLFRKTEDGAEVLAYNKRIFSGSPLICSVDEEEDDDVGMFTTAAWRVGRWLEGCRDGAVSISYNGTGHVLLNSSRTSIKCGPLNPVNFPFWDEGLKSAEVIGSVEPNKLAATLTHAGKFAADEETTQPHLAQVEARDGALWSSDRFAVSMVDFPAAPDMSIRINTKDISSLARFLSMGDTDIEVLENPKTSFFRRPDGSLFGVARPPVQFPKLQIDREAVPAATFQLPLEDLRDAILQLSAAAAKDDKVVGIRHDEGNLVLSMNSETDGQSEFPITTSGITNGEVFDEGFNIEYNYLQAIGASFDLDTLTFGVHPVGAGGYLSFRHTGESTSDPNPNNYYTVVVWKS